jgi:glycosyltransferase involved in cell wall biosynthesis
MLMATESAELSAHAAAAPADASANRRCALTCVLISPVRNESKHIALTIESVLKQTCRPLKWVVVDDGSTDGTADIVRPYAEAHDWIELIERPRRLERSFAAKVESFTLGLGRVQHLDYDIIGNLDGDTSFGADHLEFVLGKFAEDEKLGVAGTIFEEDGYRSDRNSFEGQSHVPGQFQLFRRKCYADIGGYVAHRAGGVDWMACGNARLRGWKTQSFRERVFFHHRPLGTAGRGRVAAAFSYGEKDYYLGGSPVWQLFRVAYQMTNRPYVIVGAAMGAGYLWALVRRIHRPVSPELIKFRRREQHVALRSILWSLVRRRRVDSFDVAPH